MSGHKPFEPMKIHKVEKLTNREDFFGHLNRMGANYTVITDPSPELLEFIRGCQTRAEATREKLIKRIQSKKDAFLLLEEAYKKGEFDEIIKHLEEAKTLI